MEFEPWKLSGGNPQNQHATLTYSSGTLLYTLTFLDGTSRIFNAGGQLTKIIDRNRNTTVLAYDSSNRVSTVTDPANRVITFSYTDPQNTKQATSVADSVGTIATYTYDGYSRLTQVTFADGSFDTFTYDGNGNSLITSVLDSQGKVLES
jgi:YD repeat-containing protein